MANPLKWFRNISTKHKLEHFHFQLQRCHIPGPEALQTKLGYQTGGDGDTKPSKAAADDLKTIDQTTKV